MMHRYVVDNECYPSVTQILHEAGFAGFGDVPDFVQERIDAKSEIGHAVHKACHYLDEDDLDLSTVDESIAGYVLAYQKFKEKHGFVPNLIEHRQIAEVDGMKYGMTLDRTGWMDNGDGEQCVIDLKCTYTINKACGVQLAGYALGVNPELGRAVVQLKPNGEFKFKPFADENDFADFKAALRVVWWRINHGMLKGY